MSTAFTDIQEKKFEFWKHGLLDVSRRNRMINYRRTKRSSLEITSPDLSSLFQRLIIKEEKISFRRRVDVSSDKKLSSLLYLMDHVSAPVELATGEIASSISLEEMSRTLRQMRNRARLSQEEQGINILYLVCGFLEWRSMDSREALLSPLVLVPVSLELQSMTAPYTLTHLDEDVVINPTLEYVLSADYGIHFPDFDPASGDITAYLQQIDRLVRENGWHVHMKMDLALLSFMKIVMYKDLEKNKERIFASPLIRAFCGDPSGLVPLTGHLLNYRHDSVPYKEIWQVVNADASQEDAILLSKNGISFALQGPPGTGKSQTITNIIAEGLAAGKKILFVSEKMAALSVVYRRLQETGLDSYCLSLHNYKAEKKAVIRDLARTLEAPARRLKTGAADFLDTLEKERMDLNRYFEELYSVRQPLNLTIYDAISELALYEQLPFFNVSEDVLQTEEAVFKARVGSLKKLRDFLKQYGRKISDNPWHDTTISMVTFMAQREITDTLARLEPLLLGIDASTSFLRDEYGADCVWNWDSYTRLCISLQSALLLFEIKKESDRYYEDIIPEEIDAARVSEISMRFRDLAQKCSDAGIGSSAYDTFEGRNAAQMQHASELETVRAYTQCIRSFNQKFGTAFPENTQGFQAVYDALKAGLSVSDFEDAWIADPRALSESRQQICAVQNKLDAVKNSRSLLYSFVDDILFRGCGLPAILNLGDCRSYYEQISGEVSGFLEEFKQIRDNFSALGTDSSTFKTPAGVKASISLYEEQNTVLQSASELIKDAGQVLGLALPCSNQSLEQVCELIAVLNIPCDFYVRWLMDVPLESVAAIAKTRREKTELINRLKSELDSEWSPGFYQLNSDEMLGKFRNEYTSFFNRLIGSYRQDKKLLSSLKKDIPGNLEDSTCIAALEKLQKYQSELSLFEASEEETRTLFGTYYSGLSTDWNTLFMALHACIPCHTYIRQYGITAETISLLELPASQRRRLSIGSRSVNEWNKDKNLFYLLQPFKEGHLLLSPEKLAYSLREEVELKRLSSSFDKARWFIVNDLRYLSRRQDFDFPDDSYTFDNLLEYFEKYQDFCTDLSSCKSSVESMENILPRLYAGDNTDWSSLEKVVLSIESLNKAVGSPCSRESLLRWLSLPASLRAAEQFGEKKAAEYLMESFTGSVSSLASSYGVSADDTKATLKKNVQILQEMDVLHSEIKQILPVAAVNASIKSASGFLQKSVDVDRILSDNISGSMRVLENSFGIKCRDSEMISELTELFADTLNVDVIHTEALRILEELLSAEQITDKSFSDLIRTCPLTIPDATLLLRFSSFFKGENFTEVPFAGLIPRVLACSNLEYLNEWITYSNLCEDCAKKGLDDYLSYLREHPDIPPAQTVSIYKRGFLTKWLMDLLVNCNISCLMNFQSGMHEATIDHFRQGDENQLKLARARICDLLSQEKPLGDAHITGAMDEVSILKKEASKKARIMPLRKLFKLIPSLLQKLKPCFMMSPLSVSYFLDSEVYHFDMVIFDEASQILPEDAVGAIYRADQAIITGDTRQMPPTSFFTTAVKNEDYDVDDSDDDSEYIPDIISESILDEANTCLPSCTLLWHYRSKDESLIAFSNKEIYDNRLITFPNCRKGEGRGLEYIYVPDGCYHNRSNLQEAQKCVQLVEEHVQKHPDRSLGIIAFSEKQQTVIEDAINDFRMNHPAFEDFFSEDKEEPFFIKNLENVQGDERDTIIFSICYGKNRQGRMYMRFGPLGLTGGERRLNVAVTRAKYNVKLIGSILPADIDLNKTQAEGVRLLREYIYYAMQNDYSIPPGLDISDTGEQFIDMVADFLYEHGYKFRRNVGESSYKVDIAVINPDAEDEYIAGIECDGDNYTLARTVRDRDVLRRQIMKAMGWRIHHVWSFNWFKNPSQEKERLLSFLENTCKNISSVKGKKSSDSSEPTPKTSHEEAPGKSMSIDSLTEVEKTTSSPDKIILELYRTCDPFKAPNISAAGNNLLSGRILYVMEQEAPIHKDLLYKRMAPVFGNKKATAPIRRAVDSCIRDYLSERILERNDFLYIPGQNNIRARAPETEDDLRPIEYICPEEIQDAILRIIAVAFGLTPEGLTAETAKAFGYERTGPKLRQYIAENLQHLLDEGILGESEGRIFRKN